MRLEHGNMFMDAMNQARHTAAQIEFTINGAAVRLQADPEHTLLDYLRKEQGLVGTKEGCNEGDCGACTVMVSERSGTRIVNLAVNSCILLLPQLHGKAVRTVEGVCHRDGSPNCVQQAMIDCHASQCGFCTPGFVMSLVAGHLNREDCHNDVVAGNLCRCTGYKPIVEAAERAFEKNLPAWSNEITGDVPDGNDPVEAPDYVVHRTLDEFAEWYAENPAATIVAGATDVGLWVTKQFRGIKPACFVAGIPELRAIRTHDGGSWVGAGVTLAGFGEFVADAYPSLAELVRRFGSVQVRNSATVGGNVANGSPIGDLSPALIALRATVELRRGDHTRTIPVEDFFVDYGKQDIRPGEFLQAVNLPRPGGSLKCYKLSKRFDQDISAVCGCINIQVEDGRVEAVRIAYGGLAATPKRAKHAEAAILGRNWNEETVQGAMAALPRDFSPISDMRASAEYRMLTAQNLLYRCFLEDDQPTEATDILGITP